MKTIKSRLKLRLGQFKEHPLTKDKPYAALWRYIGFHLTLKLKKEIVFNWIEGLKFVARKGAGGIVGNIYYGLYEFNESMFVLHTLRKEDTFLDIGANVGHYTMLASGINGCRSIAIEPVPKTMKYLKENIELNNLESRVELFNCGVSNTQGNLYFSNDRGTMDRIVDSDYKNRVNVRVDTIDNIVQDTCPILIKMDVEGYEKFALQGAHKTLCNPTLRIVILELNESGRKFGADDQSIYDTMLSYGFKPYSYNPLNRSLEELLSYNKKQFNTIFARDIHFVLKRIKEADGIQVGDKLY